MALSLSYVCYASLVSALSLLIHLVSKASSELNFRRDISSLSQICKLKCTSKCLVPGLKKFDQCLTECGQNSTLSCRKMICLPTECHANTVEGDLMSESDSEEDNMYRTPTSGSLAFERSLASFRIRWTQPDSVLNSSDGLVMYFVENLHELTWNPQPTTFLKPEAVFLGRCQSSTVRFVAVDSRGIVSASPFQSFNYSANTINSLNMNEVKMSGLYMFNNTVRGQLSWKLPSGIISRDVSEFNLGVDTGFNCSNETVPHVSILDSKEQADVQNMTLSCRYVFRISFTTTCGEKSQEAVYTIELNCNTVERSRCSRADRLLAKGTDRPELIKLPRKQERIILGTDEKSGAGSEEKKESDRETDEDMELSKGALAGAIAGPLIVLLFLSILGVFFYRRYKIRLQEKLSKKLLASISTSSSSSSETFPTSSPKLSPQSPTLTTPSDQITARKFNSSPPPNTDRWELDHSRVVFGDEIGKGAYGEVLKGIVIGPLTTYFGHVVFDCPVAIKLLPDTSDLSEKDVFLREIQTMKTLGHHNHIVGLLGACITYDPILLVLEYCSLGDLRSYLASKRLTAITLHTVDTSPGYLPVTCVSQLTVTTLLSFARQIALGMEYVHYQGYIHRDLAARNILVTDTNHVKIADFGLARYLSEDCNYVMLSPGKLPLKWMAIESIVDLTFSPATDIWSFGVVLFEIITMGGTPYPTVSNKDLLKHLKEGFRMDCPENCSQGLYKVMEDCWVNSPQDRPPFSTLQLELSELLECAAGPEKYLKFDSDKDYYRADPSKYQY